MSLYNDQQETIIMMTYPGIKTIVFGLLGTMFFGYFAFSMVMAEWPDSPQIETVISSVILCGFFFFAFACLLWVLKVKSIVLTNRNLTVRQPLLFYSKNIPISNIKSIDEIFYKNNYAKTVIELKTGKKISLSSFDSSEYHQLKANLSKLIRK